MNFTGTNSHFLSIDKIYKRQDKRLIEDGGKTSKEDQERLSNKGSNESQGIYL